MVIVSHDKPLTIDKVKTLDDFFICSDAVLAIRKAISKVTATLLFNRDEVRGELTAEVAAKLVKYLGQTSRKKIGNKKFLASPNRLGWVSLFTQKTARGWIADRFKDSVGDKRVSTALVKGYLPAETLESQLARARAEEASLAFDLYQFAGEKCKRRIGPDDDTGDAYEPAAQHHDLLVDERLVLVRDAVAKLAKRDRTFVDSYFDHALPRSPAERKRFSRLVLRLRDLCHVSQKQGIHK
jgi:hypothetical protein